MNNSKALHTGKKKLLYAEDRKRVLRQITDEEANRLLVISAIGWFDHANGPRLCVMPIPQQSREYDHERSFGGGVIRLADIEENAMPGKRARGINRYGGEDPQIVGNFTDHAMTKIEMWPLVGDDRAVRVSNGVFCRLR